MRIILVFALAFVVSFSAFAVTDSGAEGSPSSGCAPLVDGTGDAGLTTQFASDNNYAGNSFDIVGTQQIILDGFDINLDNADLSEFTIDIYYREGTAYGYETSAAGWNLLSSQVITASGVDVPSHVDINDTDAITIEAGETVGFIITAQEAVSGIGGFMYTNGGPNTYSDAFIDIVTYCGLPQGFPPASTFVFRSWNGTVYYWYGTALERRTWGSIKVGYSE
ncbi:MAG: hypothetical protein KAR44_07715 [Candidatus Aegiribacteria sp.]|nr:hypothetical protein [Candidatus Aegiribacteria sp.]